mgnify:FL=1
MRTCWSLSKQGRWHGARRGKNAACSRCHWPLLLTNAQSLLRKARSCTAGHAARVQRRIPRSNCDFHDPSRTGLSSQRIQAAGYRLLQGLFSAFALGVTAGKRWAACYEAPFFCFLNNDPEIHVSVLPHSPFSQASFIIASMLSRAFSAWSI